MPLIELVPAAGLRLIQLVDQTDRCRALAESVRSERARHETVLRVEEGDDVFEEEQERRLQIRTAIDEGLLMRSLVVAERA